MPLPSTQKSIDIAGIKDGIVIMKNGEYRIIISVSSINFSLKSEEEKNAIIFQFQSFLNSLHFPIEIVIRSKRVELGPYLEKIKALANKQTNEQLKNQAIEYVAFVSKLIEVANIMKKSFYVVIKQNALVPKARTGLIGNLFNKQTAETLRIAEEEYKKNIEMLKEKATTICSGLSAMGLRSSQLMTDEIINFFYQAYNPDLADKQRLKDIEATLSANTKPEQVESPNEEKIENMEIKNVAPVIQTQAIPVVQPVQQPASAVPAGNIVPANFGQQAIPNTAANTQIQTAPGGAAPSPPAAIQQQPTSVQPVNTLPGNSTPPPSAPGGNIGQPAPPANVGNIIKDEEANSPGPMAAPPNPPQINQ